MPVTIATQPTLGIPQKPLRRSSTDCILGGVAKGLAVRLGAKERTLRILFSLGALVGGAGVLVYVVLWLFMTRSGEERSIAQRLGERRRDMQLVLVAFAVALVALFSLQSVTFHLGGSFTWTLLLSLVGTFAIWQGATRDERQHLQEFLSAAPIIGTSAQPGLSA